MVRPPVAGQRLFELTPPVIGRRRAGDEIDELGIAEQGRQVGAGLVGLEPGGRVGDLRAAARGAAASAAGWSSAIGACGSGRARISCSMRGSARSAEM